LVPVNKLVFLTNHFVSTWLGSEPSVMDINLT